MAVFKGNLDIDPRGMIYESYRIENITIEECRMIFLDWAMNSPKGDMPSFLKQFLVEYEKDNPDHPMTKIIWDGLKEHEKSGKRRGGRNARLK